MSTPAHSEGRCPDRGAHRTRAIRRHNGPLGAVRIVEAMIPRSIVTLRRQMCRLHRQSEIDRLASPGRHRGLAI